MVKAQIKKLLKTVYQTDRLTLLFLFPHTSGGRTIRLVADASSTVSEVQDKVRFIHSHFTHDKKLQDLNLG